MGRGHGRGHGLLRLLSVLVVLPVIAGFYANKPKSPHSPHHTPATPAPSTQEKSTRGHHSPPQPSLHASRGYVKTRDPPPSGSHSPQQHQHNHGHGRHGGQGGGGGGTFTARSLNLQLEQQTSLEDLLRVVGQRYTEFNVVNCATALNRLARVAHQQRERSNVITDPRFASLMAQTLRLFDASRPAQQNQFLSALAKLGVRMDDDVLERLMARVAADVTSYKLVEIAGAVNAMAKMAEKGISYPPSLLQALKHRTVEVMWDGSCPDIVANVYCSLVKLGHTPGQDFVRALEDRLSEDLQVLDSHWLAQVLSCLSRGACMPTTNFLEAARDEMLRRLNRMGPLDIAMSVSALGRMCYAPGSFFYLSLVNHVKKRLARFNTPQTLSLLANGLSNMPGQRAPPYLAAAIANIAKDTLADYKPQELATLLAALGKLKGQRPDPAFITLAQDLVHVRLHQFTAVDVSNTVLGFRKLGFRGSPELVSSLRQRCIAAAELSRPDPRDVAHLLMAFGRLGEAPGEDVMESVVSAFSTDDVLQRASIQSLGMVVSAVSRLGATPGQPWLAQVAAAGLGPPTRQHAHSNTTAMPKTRTHGSPESALHVTMLLQGLERLDYEPLRGQLDLALARMAPHLPRLSARCLFNTLFTLARWDHHACREVKGGQAFLEAITAELPRTFASLEPAQLVICAWALHTLGYQPPVEVLEAFRTVVASAKQTSFTDGEAFALLRAVEGMGANIEDYSSLLLLRLKRQARQQREADPRWRPPASCACAEGVSSAAMEDIGSLGMSAREEAS